MLVIFTIVEINPLSLLIIVEINPLSLLIVIEINPLSLLIIVEINPLSLGNSVSSLLSWGELWAIRIAIYSPLSSFMCRG